MSQFCEKCLYPCDDIKERKPEGTVILHCRACGHEGPPSKIKPVFIEVHTRTEGADVPEYGTAEKTAA